MSVVLVFACMVLVYLSLVCGNGPVVTFILGFLVPRWFPVIHVF